MANTNRRHWIVVATALAAVVTATAVATTFSSADGSNTVAAPTASSVSSSRPVSAAPTSSAPKRAQPLLFGLDYSDTLTFATPAHLSAALDDAKQLNATYIRVDFGWEDYQSFADYPPDFSNFDKVVAAANARGLKILATLDFPPPWARRPACVTTSACAPADNAVFAQFVKQAVTRYAPRGVHYWEVWNEPNIDAWAPSANPADYTKLLIAGSKAIRAADPHSYILMGGMAAGLPAPGAHYIAPYDFISGVAKAGGLKAVDAVAYHPYPSGDTATSGTFQAISASPNNIVAALTAAGVPDMPVWITETGANIPHGEATPPPLDLIKSEEADQAVHASQEVAVLNANKHVAAMFWFSDQDAPSEHLYFGLRAADGRQRPAFAALQKAIAAVKQP